MPVIVARNFGRLADEIQFSTTDLMREVGLAARELILRRTAQGIAVDGSAFQPYSAAYAVQKAKAVGGAGNVDLQLSGRMLQGLVITEVSENSVTLGFSN